MFFLSGRNLTLKTMRKSSKMSIKQVKNYFLWLKFSAEVCLNIMDWIHHSKFKNTEHEWINSICFCKLTRYYFLVKEH